jgi:aspartyl/asparaginyl beta-hydroxylase (cupin superfamily)
MNNAVNELIEAAGQSARSGNWQQAEALWQKVVDIEPTHAQALCSLGVHALQRGDTATALLRLAEARQSAPADFLILMTLAAACRQSGDASGEREAIDAALNSDPYFVPALLAKADWMERFSTPSAAAATYSNALKISPPERNWPADFRSRLLHARDYVSRHSKALHEHLLQRLASRIDALPPSLADRWREAASIRAGLSQPQVSISNQLYIPRLPALPFFDRNDFPFLDELEAKTDVIRAELEAAIETDQDKFRPYIAYNPGDPVNQWRELNHSDRWSAYHLWHNGKPNRENLERCPETARALQTVSLAGIDGLCPNVFFSALQPHTHIPPHNGESNARLIAHLPLIVPDHCIFRVGFDRREWEVGKVMIFDDTIEHEAINDSDELRVVLIFDLWNPLLSTEERDLTSRLAIATRTFGAAQTAQVPLPRHDE